MNVCFALQCCRAVQELVTMFRRWWLNKGVLGVNKQLLHP